MPTPDIDTSVNQQQLTPSNRFYIQGSLADHQAGLREIIDVYQPITRDNEVRGENEDSEAEKKVVDKCEVCRQIDWNLFYLISIIYSLSSLLGRKASIAAHLQTAALRLPFLAKRIIDIPFRTSGVVEGVSVVLRKRNTFLNPER